MHKKTHFGFVAFLLVFALVAGSASASIITTSVSGLDSGGNAISATLELEWDDSANKLTVEISNTSSDNSVITGFGLMGATVSTLPGDFTASGTQNNLEWFAANLVTMTPQDQFGTFDFAGDTPPDGLNSGTPSAGILAGTSAIFMFSNVAAPGISEARDFLEEANSNGLTGALRFQRTGDGEESGKLGIGPLPPGGSTTIPEPGSMAIWSLIACGCMWRRRRRA